MHIVMRVRIHRPIREVFEFVSAPEHLPLWVSGVSRAERTYPGPMGLGATFEVMHDGKAHKECWEVIEYEPPRVVAYRRLDGRSFPQTRYTLERIDGTTSLELEVQGGLGMSLERSPLLQQESERQLEADLGRLREVLEGNSDQDRVGTEPRGTSEVGMSKLEGTAVPGIADSWRHW